MVCLLTGSRVQAQPLPQPPLHLQPPPLSPLHETCEQDINSRGLWFDQFGDVDIDLDDGEPQPESWFYNFVNLTNLNDPLSLFIDRSSGCETPHRQFPPSPIPNMGCLDYDPNFGQLWAGAYNESGHFWYHFYFNFYPPPPPGTGLWVDAFDAGPLFSDVFVHDIEPEQWDGLAVMPDSTLYIKSDGGFNLFHVAPLVPNPPERLADSFLLPFPGSGVEVTGNYLFVVGVFESRLYVYSRTGKYPLGFFHILDNAASPKSREVEDLDLRTVGSHIYLVGIPLGNPNQGTSVELLEWDVKPLILDNDNDGVPNVIDNCQTGANPANPDQRDSNGDGVGDACINPNSDYDHDGREDYRDNCPYVSNASQGDADRDGRGDACDDITQCFGAELLSALDNRVIDVAIGDLDNDGDGDVVTLHDKLYGVVDGPRVGTVAIRWSGSHGTIGNFSEQFAYAVSSGESCRDLVLSDVNNDGFTDIVVAHDYTPQNTPQTKVSPGITVLWNDHNNHFGELTHVPLPYSEDQGLTSRHPVNLFAIRLDGPNDPYPELVLVGYDQIPNEKGTITIVRYHPENGGSFEVFSTVELSGGIPLRAIALPPKFGEPERDIAILKNDQTVAIHRCTPTIAPYYEVTGYAAQIVDSNNSNLSNGRDLTYFRSHTGDWFDLAVIPDESNFGSTVVNVFLNNRDAQSLTLGNHGETQQLTNPGVGDQGHLWRVIRYPSNPYDGIVVLNQDAQAVNQGNTTQGVQATRFLSTGSGAGTLDVATREDLWDNSHDPTKAVMALGDISRSCGRDLVVADYFEPNPLAPAQAMPRLALARCPFNSDSRSFERPAPAMPTCALTADVDGANGANLIVGTAWMGSRTPSAGSWSSARPRAFPIGSDTPLMRARNICRRSTDKT